MCHVYKDNFWTECYENEIENHVYTPGTSVEY